MFMHFGPFRSFAINEQEGGQPSLLVLGKGIDLLAQQTLELGVRLGCPGIASPVDSCTTPAHVLAAWWRRTPRQDCHTRPPLQPHTHGPFLSSPWTLTWASRLSSRAKARLHTGHANGRSWV